MDAYSKTVSAGQARAVTHKNAQQLLLHAQDQAQDQARENSSMDQGRTYEALLVVEKLLARNGCWGSI